jgi:hypothetical protein
MQRKTLAGKDGHAKHAALDVGHNFVAPAVAATHKQHKTRAQGFTEHS